MFILSRITMAWGSLITEKMNREFPCDVSNLTIGHVHEYEYTIPFPPFTRYDAEKYI
jgi:hypothetical protein